MNRTSLLAAAALLLTFVQAGETAISQTPAGGDTTAENVVVSGRQIDRAVQAFVGEVSVESGGENQLARWDGRICPGVIGLRAEHGQAIADHIALRALDLGLDIGEPGCQANVLVLVTADSDQLARALVAERGALATAMGDAGVNTRGREALNDFVNTPRPVRWWHIARTATADGFEANPAALRPMRRDSPVPGMQSPGGSSRIVRTTRQDFSRAIIIVDARRVAGVPVGLLGDYIAMVALAQLNPDADTTQYPSILNLFAPRAAGQAAPTSLTDWDLAYLDGLYDTPRDRSQDAQRRAIEEGVRERAVQ